MDDRDKGLTHLFVRDLDEIPLPARGEWRRMARRETIVMRSSRYLLAGGAVVAVLAIALIVGYQLSQRQQSAANPSASPTGSPRETSLPVVDPRASVTPSAATPAAAVSPVSAAIYDDRFGFLVFEQQAGKASFRNESSNARLSSFDQQGFAVSPDGFSIAYWTPGSGPSPQQLRIIGGASELTLITLASGQRGGGIAWSSDGAAVAYSTDSGGSLGGAANSSTLNIYELAANGRHGTTIATETNTGWFYRPIAWDRSANIVAAGLTGEGGGMGFYVTVRINPDNSFNVQRTDTKSSGLGVLMQSVRGSSDAKFVLGVDFGSSDIRWWPLADYAAGKTQSGAGKRGALWRPGTHEIGFLSGEQLWLGDVDKAGAQGLCCTAVSGVPATSSLRTFRADGSAALIAVGSTGSAELGDFTLIRLGGDPKATSGDRVTFKELGGLATSVRFR